MIRLLAAILLFVTCHVRAENPPFDEWLGDIRRQALAQGISKKTLVVLDRLEPDPRVIKFDRHQPEFVQTFDEYLHARVSPERVQMARRHYERHAATLEAIGESYGVDAEYIVSFWGLETSFGRYQGKYSIVRSLATLGHDERRSAFFTSELFEALRILDEGHIDADSFVGAWAGAMGQGQFMPSAFNRYAQDYDGDGKKDIWRTEVDVWASIANYLKSHGWRRGAGWGVAVVLPDDLQWSLLGTNDADTGCRATRGHTSAMAREAWQGLGIYIPERVPPGQYALIKPEDDRTQTWLVGGNFRTILRYNCANKYAVSVGLLADQVRD